MNDFRHINRYTKPRTLEDGAKYMTELQKIFSPTQLEQFYKHDAQHRYLNYPPVAYVSIRKLGYRFLINSLSREKPEEAFGLCDYDTKISIEDFNLKALMEIAKQEDDTLECYKQFYPKYPLAVYAMVAVQVGVIVIEDTLDPYKDIFENFASESNRNERLSLKKLKPTFYWSL